MKILNKLAGADVVVGSCNLLNDRLLWRFTLDPVPANSHEKIGELARCRCCNTLLTNLFRNIGPANLFEKSLFPKFLTFDGGWEILSPFSKSRNFYHFINQLVA